MIRHSDIDDKALQIKIKNGNLCFGGNRNLKIYGTLHCKSGKRMKRPNRVFFASEPEAIANKYRPCGHCMRPAYKIWKLQTDNP